MSSGVALCGARMRVKRASTPGTAGTGDDARFRNSPSGICVASGTKATYDGEYQEATGPEFRRNQNGIFTFRNG